MCPAYARMAGLAGLPSMGCPLVHQHGSFWGAVQAIMKKWYTSVVPISPRRLFESNQTGKFQGLTKPGTLKSAKTANGVYLRPLVFDLTSSFHTFWIKPYPLILGRGIGVHPSVICWDLSVKPWKVFLRYQINFGTAIWLGACREGKLFLQFFPTSLVSIFPYGFTLSLFLPGTPPHYRVIRSLPPQAAGRSVHSKMWGSSGFILPTMVNSLSPSSDFVGGSGIGTFIFRSSGFEPLGRRK